MKIHQLITQTNQYSLKHRILSCFCLRLQGKCDCYNPALHIFDINESLDTSNKTDNFDDVLLDEATGEIKKMNTVYLDKNSDTHNETENVEYMSALFDETTVDNCSIKRKNDKMIDLQNNKRLKTEQQSKKRCDASDSEEDSDNGNYSLHDTSDDSVNYLDFMDVLMTQEVNDESEEVNDENEDVTNERREINDKNNFKHDERMEKEITVGSYVLVKFLTYKSQKHYIGEVIKIYDHSYTVKFLRNKGNGRFAFPITEDISVVFKNDIEEILQNPLSERRGIKTFDLKHVKIKIE